MGNKEEDKVKDTAKRAIRAVILGEKYRDKVEERVSNGKIPG
jgi:hypothetical protein